MRAAGDLTPKGARAVQSILDASLRCVGRDGFAATTMQSIADEAGVGKRAVIYYFGTREGLFDQVIRHAGDRLIDQVEAAVSGLAEPAEVVERAFASVWSAATGDRGLLAAWYGLQVEAITNPAYREAARYLSMRMEDLAQRLIDAQLARGRVLRMDRDALGVLVVANVQGLLLQHLDRGDTPGLRAAIEAFRRFLATVMVADDRAAAQ